MAYVKNIWVDQDVERPKTYEVTNNQDGSITLTDSFGLVTELGTPVNAVNMNHIEDGLADTDLTKYNATTTYNAGEWVTGVVDNEKGIYASKINNNIGNALSNDTYWEKVELGGSSSRNIGEIVASTIPLTDAGLHLLDGALINGSGIYSDFVDYIADLHNSGSAQALFATESNWQSIVTTYGACGKFVYDATANTVRLPKITGKLDGTTDVNALGDLAPLIVKLPNITGQLNIPLWTNRGTSGAFYEKSSGGVFDYGSNSGGYTAGFSASRSSSVYSGNGTDTTIHEQAVNVFYYIVIATSTKTDIEVDIDEIATDLNGKADVDLTNCTKPHIVETYINGTSWYRVYSDGFIMQGSKCGAGSIASITLLKPFTTTNYQVHSVCAVIGSTSIYGRNYIAANKTTTGFSCYQGYADTSSLVGFWDGENQWIACGY
jgi:hypothetical protein